MQALRGHQKPPVGRWRGAGVPRPGRAENRPPFCSHARRMALRTAPSTQAGVVSKALRHAGVDVLYDGAGPLLQQHSTPAMQ